MFCVSEFNNLLKKDDLNYKVIYRAKTSSTNDDAIALVKSGKKTKIIISIFAGRMADSGKDPVKQFKESIKASRKFKNVEILWASTREPYNYLQAKKLGCQIITVPPSIIEKIEKFGKSFQRLSVETVKGFLTDAKKSEFKL